MAESEMVERVALAISGSDDPANILTMHRVRARIAIRAMRKPTMEMFCAGDESILEALNDHGGVRRDPTPAEGAWMAMIDEALK